MLHKELPTRINPAQLCKEASSEGLNMSGTLFISELVGFFSPQKAQEDRPIHLSLLFSQDEEGRGRIQGELEVELTFECQRCLQPMEQKVRASFLVSPVATDGEAMLLPSYYEPLLTANGEITLPQWIAEELHLALPLVPRHQEECVSYDNNSHNGENVLREGSPFTKLKYTKF